MCDDACIEFGRLNLSAGEVTGKRVIEVGAMDGNGSLRPVLEALAPHCYIGVDIQLGPGVDELCDATQIVERFGRDSFDVVITTEMMEHVLPWPLVIANLKDVLRPGGVVILTTRSLGFPYHGAPFDFWRYELDDMRYIFADFYIERLEQDPIFPGVFIKARKPTELPCTNLNNRTMDNYELFSMIKERRATLNEVTPWDLFRVKMAMKTKDGIRRVASRVLPTTAKRKIKQLMGEP